MKKQTIPLLTAMAPAAMAVPPVAIIAALGVGLIWLLSNEEKPEQKPAMAIDAPKPMPA